MKPNGQLLVFLELLVATHQKQKQGLLQTLSDNQVAFLSGILLNILRSNIVLSETHRKKLIRYVAVIRSLANKSTPIRIKLDLYNKHHELIVLIFKPLLSLLKQKFGNGSRNGLNSPRTVE